MLKKELLKLVPTRYLCPYCGEWHDWNSNHNLAWYDSFKPTDYNCPYLKVEYGHYVFYFTSEYMYYRVSKFCNMLKPGIKSILKHSFVKIDDISTDLTKPIVTFKVPYETEYPVGKISCSCECPEDDFTERCNYCKLAEKGDHHNMHITLGFEFSEEEFFKIVKTDNMRESMLEERENEISTKESMLEERENEIKIREEELEKKQHKEETTMTASAKTIKGLGTSITTFLYENSPKENVEIIKAWSEKYKPTLRWAIPVAAVYGAYRILNSKEFNLSVNNISETCEKKLGVKLEMLEDKRALKELMALGGIAAGAYGAMKAVSGIFTQKEEKADFSVEEFESGMDKLESVSQKFAWIQPKTENMLPIAFSVIMVYIALHKPKFDGKISEKIKVLTEDWQIKIKTYIDIAKMYVEDKCKIDLSDEEQQKRMKICAFFIAIIGIFVFLYGKKVLSGKKTEEDDKEKISDSIKNFVEQAKSIIEKIAPTVYTTLITFFISKKLLTIDEDFNLIDTEGENVNENGDGAAIMATEETNINVNNDVTSDDSAGTVEDSSSDEDAKSE